MTHPQGEGYIMHRGCGVKFGLLIPKTLESNSYIILTSHGVHTHPPPPPTVTPQHIREELIDMLGKLKDDDLTTG